MTLSYTLLDVMHKKVINYLKQRLPNSENIYLDIDSSYFFQETLEDKQYRSTIILNGNPDCYVAMIHIGDIGCFHESLKFMLFKDTDIT